MRRLIPRADIKEKNFQGVLAVGAIAGILEGSVRHGFTLHTAFPGMLLTMLGAFMGGFSGFFLKDLFRTMRGMKPYQGINNEGWTMGAFLGALLGTLMQVAVSPDGGNLVVGSIVGAYMGGMLGAIPDEMITPILVMMREKDPADSKGKEGSSKTTGPADITAYRPR